MRVGWLFTLATALYNLARMLTLVVVVYETNNGYM
jgi:hypothetical protein